MFHDSGDRSTTIANVTSMRTSRGRRSSISATFRPESKARESWLTALSAWIDKLQVVQFLLLIRTEASANVFPSQCTHTIAVPSFWAVSKCGYPSRQERFLLIFERLSVHHRRTKGATSVCNSIGVTDWHPS
jgi:hypothetical protein